MLTLEHESATCPHCGRPLWYSLKGESSGWKVFYNCPPDSGCGREWMVGRVALGGVSTRDEAFEQAASMWDERGDWF
jgi:hypothetical protein